MKQAAIAFALLMLPASVQAAQPAAAPAKPVLGPHDNNAPIDISSDTFQADLNGKSGTWTGNVIVIQGDMKLRANTVHMTTVNGKADKVMANGNVVVDYGVYSVVPRTVLLTGNVVLKKGKDVMRGSQLTVNLATGQAVLGGGVKGQTQNSTRVQAVFTPNSQ
jgi:lipopolysaccharide export system protein LptA